MVNKMLISTLLFFATPFIAYYGIFEVMPTIVQYSLIFASLILSFSILALIYFAFASMRMAASVCLFCFSKVTQMFHEISSFSLRKPQNIQIVSRF